MLSPAQIRALETIQREWNQAEEDIKLAEQVCNELSCLLSKNCVRRP